MAFPLVTGSTLPIMYREAARIFGELPAFATRKATLEWTPVSFKKLYQDGCALAAALIDMGVDKQEHVGLLADNRFEWILCDYVIQLCGAADVPRGTDINDEEMVYILSHAGVKVCFVETSAMAERLIAQAARLPKLKVISIMHGPAAADSLGQTAHSSLRVTALHNLVQRGYALGEAGLTSVSERSESVTPDDLFTLIYTSGTTGTPKGVMLTHANIMSQISAIDIGIDCTDRVLSLLPVWHVYERVFEMIAISRGCCTYYSSPRHLAEDLQNVQPTFMGSAPRLWESLHQRILKSVHSSHPVRRALFHTAYFLAHYYKESVFFSVR
ncbi:MAG: AMP-binding protein [Verrucomicrobia bacterium]|nr:AMP-binding protein [Verrucomicrobiota bacterium]